MTTADDNFARRLLADAAASAPAPDIDPVTHLEAGKRRLHRRRATVGFVLVACFAILVVAIGTTFSLFRGPGAERWPVASDPGATIDPAAVLDAYEVIDRDLFTAHPDEWGGAYYDGATLVVNSVTRSGPDAVHLLRSMGVPAGVVVRKTDDSLAAFDRASAAVMADELLHSVVVSVGPQYRTASLVIGVQPGVDQASVRDRVSTVLARLGLAQLHYTVVDGGVPAAAGGQ